MIYVSGPMSGILEHNFPAFKDASARLRAAGYEVCCPTEVVMACGCSGQHAPVCGAKHAWADFVRADLIEMLQKAKGVALLPGWEHSEGAKLERYVALVLDLDVRLLEEWL